MSPETRSSVISNTLRIVTFVCTALLACTVALPAAAQSSAAESKYTKITHPPCKTRHVQSEGANSEQLCPGIDGYKLLLLDSDGRMSVTIVSPDGSRHPLDFWTTVTTHFSTIGRTAEWRLRSGVPSALILPLTIQEDPGTGRSVQYHLIIKLTPQTICILAKLPDATTSIEAAHHAADATCPQH